MNLLKHHKRLCPVEEYDVALVDAIPKELNKIVSYKLQKEKIPNGILCQPIIKYTYYLRRKKNGKKLLNKPVYRLVKRAVIVGYQAYYK